MFTVGLTGGIGSGKSTVAQWFAAQGAVVVSADDVAHDVLAPGTPGLVAVLEEFGSAVIHLDGTLDREALAQIVFGNQDDRARLEAIVHPQVREAIAKFLAAHAMSDDIVVVEIPLLAESSETYEFNSVVVVDTSPAIAIERLLRDRGMTYADAAARLAAQTSRDKRLAIADIVVTNNSDLFALESQLTAVWDQLLAAKVADHS